MPVRLGLISPRVHIWKDGKFEPLKKGIVFYITIENDKKSRPIAYDSTGKPIPRPPKEADRWCWQFKIGDNEGRLGAVGDGDPDYFGMPCTFWMFPSNGKEYNVYIHNLDTLFTIWDGLDETIAQKATTMHPSIWVDIKNEDNQQFELVEVKDYVYNQIIKLVPVKDVKKPSKFKILPMVDAHCHVMSSRCSCLTHQWASIRDAKGIDISGTNREKLEYWGSKASKFVKLGTDDTIKISKDLISSTEKVFKLSKWDDLSAATDKYVKDYQRFFLSVAMPMNLDFAHYWANYGLPVYLPISGKKGEWYYFDEYCKIKKPAPALVDPDATIENILTYDCDLSTIKDESFSFEIYDITGKSLSSAEIEKKYKKRYRHFIRYIEDTDYYLFEKQTKDHLQTAISYPFQILPFYHYDPRAHYSNISQLQALAEDIESHHTFFTIDEKSTPLKDNMM